MENLTKVLLPYNNNLIISLNRKIFKKGGGETVSGND